MRSRQPTFARPASKTDSMTVAAQRSYRIGRCTIDAGAREVRFAENVVDVQPRVFDLICYLIDHRDRAVGKDELLDNVWPNVVVSESSLAQSVKRARDIFRQHGMDDVIRTVHSRGYRFVADDVEEIAATVAERGAETGPRATLLWISGLAIAAVALATFWLQTPTPAPPPAVPQNTLVVLPFEDLTGDDVASFFPEGLTDTLSNALARVNGLRVIGRASAAGFRDGEESLSAFAGRLNVANAIIGSVQKSGEQLRITASLVRAADDSVLWSQTYDREWSDVFDVQDDVARSIVERMEALLAAELSGYEAATAVESGEAYQLLLRANQLHGRRTEASLTAATGLYREALRIDPNYAAAWLGLAYNSYQRATLGSLPREEGFPSAVEYARRTLTLDPNSASAHVLLAELQHRYFWDFDEARASFEKAFAINPEKADTLSAYSRFLSKIGAFDRAVEIAREARALNPLSQSASASLVLRLLRIGETAAAGAVLDEMRAQRPDNGDLPWLESLWHLERGDYQDALQRIVEDDFEYIRLSISAIALEHLGRSAEAQAALDELIRTDADGATFQIAEVYAQWGNADDAFEWLDRAYSHGDPGLAELHSSAHLKPVRSDPRFAELLAKVGLPPAT